MGDDKPDHPDMTAEELQRMIRFCRQNWPNDGVAGKAVNRLCDLADDMMRKFYEEQEHWRESFNRVQRHRRREIEQLRAIRLAAFDPDDPPIRIVGTIQEILNDR